MSGKPSARPRPKPLARLVALGSACLAGWLALTFAATALADARPPVSETAPDDVTASFERFVVAWLDDARRLAPADRVAVPATGGQTADERARPGTDGKWSIEIRVTQDATVPYVGLLRYVEERRVCADSPGRACRTTATPVTEIFRFQDGRWVY